jgi:hypothetical protein
MSDRIAQLERKIKRLRRINARLRLELEVQDARRNLADLVSRGFAEAVINDKGETIYRAVHPRTE